MLTHALRYMWLFGAPVCVCVCVRVCVCACVRVCVCLTECFSRLQHVKYTRSHEDDLHLGLLDMQTENYNPEMAAIIEEEERVAAAAARDAESAACESPAAP
jgi:hypothetical protein